MPVTVYVPAARPVFAAVVRPLDHTKPTAPVPPVEDAVAAPVELPKQSTLVCDPMLTFNAAAGCDIVTEAIDVQPLASVPVTVYVPAARPVFAAVVVPLDHKNPTAPVPPVELAVAAPVELPKQRTLVGAPTLTLSAAAGWVIVTEATEVQPFASVPVTVYVPAARPVLEAVVRPLDHKNPTAPVPPVEDAVAAPVELPKQRTLVCEPMLTLSAAAGCDIVTLEIELHPLTSVPVTVYVPAARPVLAAVVRPFDHKNPTAPVPPVEDAVAAPVELPKQRTLVCDPMLTFNAAAGCDIVTEAIEVQPFASVPVTVYVPAARPVFKAVVRPFDHKNPTAPVPPVELAVAAPVELPKQRTFVCEPMLTFNAAAG